MTKRPAKIRPIPASRREDGSGVAVTTNVAEPALASTGRPALKSANTSWKVSGIGTLNVATKADGVSWLPSLTVPITEIEAVEVVGV